MFTPLKSKQLEPKSQLNLKIENIWKHDLTFGSPWFTYKSPNWKERKHLPSTSIFLMLQKMVNFFGWMDSHGALQNHLRSCLFGKVEKHKWNRTGDGQTEASETKGTRVKRYGFRISSVEYRNDIEYYINLIRSEKRDSSKCIFLHGPQFQLKRSWVLLQISIYFYWVAWAPCFLLVLRWFLEFSAPSRLAGGADSGEEYGYKSRGKVQTVAWRQSSLQKTRQGGGNSNIVDFHPSTWRNGPIWTNIFLQWVGSTTN